MPYILHRSTKTHPHPLPGGEFPRTSHSVHRTKITHPLPLRGGEFPRTSHIALRTIILLLFLSSSLFAQSPLQFNAQISAPIPISEDSDSAYVYLYLEAKAGEKTSQHQDVPLNISMVLDRSGSMSGAKMDYAKEAAKFVIDNLSNEDQISIITYDQDVQIVSYSGSAKQKRKLKKLVDMIGVKGATNLSGGMLEGFTQVSSTYDDSYVNHIMLMSDGYANKGITDQQRLQDTVQYLNQNQQITLSTFGLGADFDEDLMEALADYGGGNYYFIHKATKVPEVFLQELSGLQSVVARRLLLEVEYPNETLVLSHVFGYPYLQDSLQKNQLLIPFNDVIANETQAVLIRFLLPPSTSKASSPISDLQASFSYENTAIPSDTHEHTIPLQKDSVIHNNIVLFEANQTTRDAISVTEKGMLSRGIELVNKNENYMDNQFSRFSPDTLLHAQYKLNRQYIKDVQANAEKSTYKRKMIQKFAKYNSYRLRKKK